MSSFIETTLPPGYAMLSSDRYGTRGWEWTSGTRAGRWLPTRGECRRAAWRHWTATVLRGRGRDVEWLALSTTRRVSTICARVIWNPYQRRFEVDAKGRDEDEFGEWRSVRVHSTTDPDEAMARFAALVLAAEGMVAR